MDIYFYNATLEQWIAQDASCNVQLNLCTLTVSHFSDYILGVLVNPRQIKISTIPLLENLKSECQDNNNETNVKKCKKEIEKSISHLETSIQTEVCKDKKKSEDNEPKCKLQWLNDTNLAVKDGDKVFSEEKKALKKLMKLYDKKNISLIPKGDVVPIILKILSADSLLAENAIQFAGTVEVSDPINQEKFDKEIGKALENLQKAEDELVQEKFDKAIDKFKEAWMHAQKAIKEAG